MQKNFLIIFIFMFAVGFVFSPAYADMGIPQWIKNNAGWWAEGAIDDSSFVQGIEFIMKEGLLKPNLIPDEFPSYLKTESKNWSEGIISDKEYLLILENWIGDNNKKAVDETYSSSSSSYVKQSESYQNQIKTGSNIETGLKVGQWIIYSPSISVGGDVNIKKMLEPTVRAMKDQFEMDSGFIMDNAIWIKYTVADISGTVVTFDRSVKLANNSETREISSYFNPC